MGIRSFSWYDVEQLWYSISVIADYTDGIWSIDAFIQCQHQASRISLRKTLQCRTSYNELTIRCYARSDDARWSDTAMTDDKPAVKLDEPVKPKAEKILPARFSKLRGWNRREALLRNEDMFRKFSSSQQDMIHISNSRTARN
ncbi:hypothetical protein TrVFT333_010954 [Trichoderma virens FT-333]|nr:hypothetical protein TrVFT333_010954 [Trichoderma virens FT-333]